MFPLTGEIKSLSNCPENFSGVQIAHASWHGHASRQEKYQRKSIFKTHWEKRRQLSPKKNGIQKIHKQ